MPPNLDLHPPDAPPPQQPGTSEILNALTGAVCLLDSDGIIRAVNDGWDDVMSRTGRTEMSSASAVGAPLWNLLQEGDDRSQLQKAFKALAEGHQKQHSQTADFSVGQRPLALTVAIRSLRQDNVPTGFLVQVSDATAEQVSRMALLDRERRLREMRSLAEHQSEEIVALQKEKARLASGRDFVLFRLLSLFRRSPVGFGAELCKVAVETTNAKFAALAMYVRQDQTLRIAAEHNAPGLVDAAAEVGFFEVALGEGPAGTAAQSGCPVKFDQVREREDFVRWTSLAAQMGFNCIWAFPLEDPEGLYGALQLFYEGEDVPLPMDKYSALTMLCHAATPLLRVSDECIRQVAEAVSVSEPEPTAAPEPESPPASAGADDFRVLAAALAEEYGNLLTGVLGHTSLAMTEMGEGHSGLEDIRAIERSARGAARLTRRLSALCGSAHRGQAPLEVGPHMRTYVTRERADFFADGPAGLALPDAPCSVHMDGATLDIVLDGMADHARTALTAGPPVWSVSSHDGVVDFTLSYSGSPALPQGWLDHRLPLHSHAPLPELFFSREAARALGGDLEVRETDHGTDMVLTLPLMETRPAHEITPAPA